MESEPLTWPEERISSARVRKWIGQALVTTVSGPTIVYRPTGWGVVAGFETASVGLVVFKAGYAPEDAYSPVLYPLLNACAKGHVPELLASVRDGGDTWLLFKPFAGSRIRDLAHLPPILEMARTLARIQCEVSKRLRAEPLPLLHFSITDLPEVFDRLIEITDAWDEPEFSRTNLSLFRAPVAAWTAELAAGNWPDSLDHPDMHTNNAIVQANGSVLIFDWEGAVVTNPFFAMNSLMENAGRLDRTPDSTPLYTPMQAAVRDAYLAELPWGTLPERERAFEIAQCLARIVRVHQHLALFDALVSDRLVCPGGFVEKRPMILYSLREARRRWEILTGKVSYG